MWRFALVMAVGCAHAVRAVETPPSPAEGDWRIRWDRSQTGWSPPIFDGELRLHRDNATWHAEIRFQQSEWQLQPTRIAIDGDRIAIAFGELELAAWIHGERLVGEIRTERIAWSPVSGARIEPLRTGHVDHSLPAGELLDTGDLLAKAAEQNSSAVVILRDGAIVTEAYRAGYDGRPIVAMSASKSIVGLAIGRLIGDGKLSLDTRIADLFPAWQTPGKDRITVRHLLSHTSGLDPSRAQPSESIEDHAAKAVLVFEPGTRFQYNNGAVDFLAVVATRAAGMPFDAYVQQTIFEPLDIVGAQWMRDAAGVARGAGELVIRPVDLAKLGQLMLDGGAWHGRQIVPREWVAQATAASQPFTDDYGLLWWRDGSFSYVVSDAVLAAWRDAGVLDPVVDRVRPLVGVSFRDLAAWRRALGDILDADALTKLGTTLSRGDHVPLFYAAANGPVRGFSARGWLGEFLVVVPDRKLVAVRMRKPEAADYDGRGGERDGFPEFPQQVLKLAR
jgi:CubicO group peptidase (beta-lactamase class C family)